MVPKGRKFEACTTPGDTQQDLAACTFFIKTVQAAAVKLLCDVLKDIVHDVTLRLDDRGVTCNCIEHSKTCYVNMVLHADRFDVFYCPLTTDISLSMEQLSILVGMCGHNDQLSLYQERLHTDVIVILIESQTQGDVMKKKWELKLKAMDTYTVDLPPAEYLSIITMSSAFFHSTCRSCSKVSDVLVIESLSDKLRIGVRGSWAGGAIEISQTKDCSFLATSPKEYRGAFALRFLLMFTKATGLSNTVELYLAEDYPLVVKYMIADLGELQLSQTALIDDDDPDEDMEDDEEIEL